MSEPFDKVAGLYLDQVDRLEIIDHTPCKRCGGSGREMSSVGSNIDPEGNPSSVECGVCEGSGVVGTRIIFKDPNKQIELSLQDDERTLKIFITERVK
jgi:DnaJ-class molecular chaperone